MTTASIMVCRLCGKEAAETLITLARWESIADRDGQPQHFCPECAERHRTRERLLLASETAVTKEPSRTSEDSATTTRRLVRALAGAVRRRF